jgi:DNA-binding beta-propeller fold protein YncE
VNDDKHGAPVVGAMRLPSVIAAMTALCLAFGVACLLCQSALAVRGHAFEKTFGSEGVGPGQFKEPSGVAVNEATGTVYVLDTGNSRVQYFTSAGAFLGEITGTSSTGTGNLTEGSSTIESAAAATGKFSAGQEISGPGIPAGTTITAVSSFGSLELSNPVEAGGSASFAELSAHQSFDSPDAVAVDNSCTVRHLPEPKCREQDPSSGALYVVDAGHGVVDKFAPAGNYLGQLQESSGGGTFHFDVEFEGAPVGGVAVDEQGTVWVYSIQGISQGWVRGFAAGEPTTFTGAAGLLETTTSDSCAAPGVGLAVDSKGDFYSLRPDSSDCGFDVKQIAVEDSPETVLTTIHQAVVLADPFVLEESRGIAVDLASDEVLIDNGESIGGFDSSGRLEERFGSGHLTAGSGLAVSHALETVYVADPVAGAVDVFSPTPPSAPSVQSESVVEVSSTSASLTAEVNPQSEAGEANTEYRFEYLTDADYQANLAAGRAPFADAATTSTASISPSFEVQAVGSHVQNLVPATIYHYRLVAENQISKREGKPAEGQRDEHGLEVPHTFTTQGSGAATLPDGRAWELVSPADKHGSQLLGNDAQTANRASANGEEVSYTATLPTEADVKGYQAEEVLSSRTAAGWSSKDVSLAHASPVSPVDAHEYRIFSNDMSVALVEPLGEKFSSLAPEVFPQDTEPGPYVRHNSTCPSAPGTCFEPLLVGCPAPSQPCSPAVAEHADVPPGTKFGPEHTPSGSFVKPALNAANADLSHIVLASPFALTGTPTEGKSELYEVSPGNPPGQEVQLVSLVPNESGEEVPAQGEPGAGYFTVGSEGGNARHAVSENGSRVVFTENAHLYLRDLSLEKTAQLDLPEPQCVAEASCGEGSPEAHFQLASADSSRILFTDRQRLTANAGPEGSADLYQCQIQEVSGAPRCELSDLTPAAGPGQAAGVVGSVLGASEDASWVYFAATGVLGDAGQQGASPGSCKNSEAPAGGGVCHLYLYHDGETHLIATVDGKDLNDWAPRLAHLTARVSPDGSYLAFMSLRSLTGYDNRDAATAVPDQEVFLYHAEPHGPGALTCVSCNPTGARPVGTDASNLDETVRGFQTWERGDSLAANIPAWTAYEVGLALDQTRYLSNEGRLFFNSHDALVPRDINGDEDVYEFEPAGVGDCSHASVTFHAQLGGCVALISSGRAAGQSAFLDASHNGDDVFFLTSESLMAGDTDTALDVYDAHVCSSESPCFTDSTSPPACITADACRPAPAPQPSAFGAPASATFSGRGNVAPQPPPAPKPKTAAAIRAEKLARALRACRRKHPRSKARRIACERAARRLYAPKSRSAVKRGR